MTVKFNVIAAACEGMGIGNKNTLPWRLKNEMAYFTRMTTGSGDDGGRKNAVIMGRKTWESIPKKYKPLAGRFNVVITKTIENIGYEDAVVFKTLSEALATLALPPYSNKISELWVIGGAVLYNEALESPHCHRVYLTKVMKKFECDTFFPNIPSDKFREISDEAVSKDIQEENGIRYQFHVYEASR